MTLFVMRGMLLVQFLLLHIAILAGASGDEPWNFVPGSYIVEFADQLGDHENAFFSDITAGKILAKPRLSLSSPLFKGLSINLDATGDVHGERKTIERIASLRSVKNVYPMRRYTLPYEVISTGDPNQAIRRPREHTQKRAADDDTTLSIHAMTGVDKLHEEGYTGSGIKVAVVDTGVDYTHPDLGGCFGSGCKVAYGYDLVGDDYTGENEPVPDPDPYDKCSGHGTHVAGIIAANSNEQDYFSGVAPNVTLGAYRVMGCGGAVTNDILMKAFIMAYEAGSDIITSSVGGSGGWSEGQSSSSPHWHSMLMYNIDPLDVVVSRIVAAGVPCTLSAGNSGTKGPFSSSTPAGAIGATSVASVDNDVYPMLLVPGTYLLSENDERSFGWAPGSLSNVTSGVYPLYAVSHNTSSENDGCHRFPAEPADLSRYIVLMRRGGCTFSQKAGNAAARGAKHILFYNSEPGVSPVYAYAPGIESAGMVPGSQGEEWIRLLSVGAKVRINIVQPEYVGRTLMDEPNGLTGGYLSTFTSWGPSFEVRSKPQIAAPGGLIASTYSRELGGYAVLSGTSMSCPFAAGSIALLMEARGKLDPATINNLLSSTADPSVFHDGRKHYPYLAPVPQQGGGLINVYNAVHATTLLDESAISFNDTENLEKSTGFTIENNGPASVTYQIDHLPGATFYTFSSGGSRSTFTKGQPPDMLKLSADLSFSVSEATVQPGESVYIHITPKPPVGLLTPRIPVYSGYIAINSTHGESFTLPYIGVDSSLRTAPVLVKEHVFLSSTARPDTPWAAHYQFPLPPPNSTRAKNPNILAPAAYIELRMGSPLLRVDVQPVDRNNTLNTTNVLGEEIIGSVDGFPSAYIPSVPVQSGWRGKLSDGSYAPAGNYTFLVRALKIFGDPGEESDYERVRTKPFGIWYG